MADLASAILLLGKLSFAGVGVAVGWKLLGEFRHHGGVGLHAVALAAIAMGGVGLVTIPIGEVADSLAIVLAGEVMVRIAMVLLCVFIARTFRPSSSLGTTGGSTCAALLLATLAWDVAAQPSMTEYDFALRSAQANQLSIALPFAWSALESAILFQRARRRLSIGLAEPVVVMRYALWVVATGGFVMICVLAALAGEAQRAGLPAWFDAAQGARGLLYVVASVSIALGIFPALAGEARAHPPEASAEARTPSQSG